jgi:hypothetical protein
MYPINSPWIRLIRPIAMWAACWYYEILIGLYIVLFTNAIGVFYPVGSASVNTINEDILVDRR